MPKYYFERPSLSRMLNGIAWLAKKATGFRIAFVYDIFVDS